MKWILVVMVCWGLDCTTIYEQTLYDNEDQCLEQATIVTEYAQKTYPQSTGQVWCVTTDEFQGLFKPVIDA